MINFKPENLNQLLKVMLVSANKSYDAIKSMNVREKQSYSV